MTPAIGRRALRWLHVVGSAVLGIYLYSPWGAEPALRTAVLFGVFPLLALSGAAMWLWPQIVRAGLAGRAPARNGRRP